MKPGYKTTEFWIPILTLLTGFVLVLSGHREVGAMLLGGGGVQGANYQNGRNSLKKKGAKQ